MSSLDKSLNNQIDTEISASEATIQPNDNPQPSVNKSADNPWLELLTPLRKQLTGRDTRGNKGSLRWIQAVIAERGGRGSSVRNILYKNLGSLEEKRRLFELISELYEEIGLDAPPSPEDYSVAQAKRSLGRDKRLIFARFLREFQAGMKPQIIVVGSASTGKRLLIEQLRDRLPSSLYVNLSKNIAPSLFELCGQLGIAHEADKLMSQLSPKQPFALQAALQKEFGRVLIKALNAKGELLLLRAEVSANIVGVPLRDENSTEQDVARWLEPLLARLEIPYLAALSSSPAQLVYSNLRPPSRDEARKFLRQHLPKAPQERLEEMLNQVGQNYAELARMSMIESVRQDDGDRTELQVDGLKADGELEPLLNILAILSPETDSYIPKKLFETVVGHGLHELRHSEKELIEQVDDESLRPAFRELLPNSPIGSITIHQQALDYFQTNSPNSIFRLLHHAEGAQQYNILLELLETDPARLLLCSHLWQNSVDWQQEQREQLALLTLRHRSVQSDYAHEETQEALSYLVSLEGNSAASSWAKIKLAESYVDAAQYKEAIELMNDLPQLDGDVEAEACLVRAAILRWQGEYTKAKAEARKAKDHVHSELIQDRVSLWQGLVSKDAGEFDDALEHLAAVQHHVLLQGRARYHEGDLLMRIGKPQEASKSIQQAITQLQLGAPPTELAKIQARHGTVLRRLGQFEDADAAFQAALAQNIGDFTKARIQSEYSVLFSARGHPWEALRFASQSEAFFRQTSERSEEAAYRHKRSLYRLAIAYCVWRTGKPYCQPFRGELDIASAMGTSMDRGDTIGGNSSLQHAKAILRNLIADTESLKHLSHRYSSLFVDACIALALVSPPRKALALLADAIEVPSRFLKLQVQLAITEALLRADKAAEAAAQLTVIRSLPADPSIRAWKALLEAEMLIMLGQAELAPDVINECLDIPAALRVQLGRIWGQVLQDRSYPELAKYWLNPNNGTGLQDSFDGFGVLDLPEALALHFEGLNVSTDS